MNSALLFRCTVRHAREHDREKLVPFRECLAPVLLSEEIGLLGTMQWSSASSCCSAEIGLPQTGPVGEIGLLSGDRICCCCGGCCCCGCCCGCG